VKVVFFMAHGGHARNFEWTLRLLAERGHEVVVALDLPTDRRGAAEPLAGLAHRYPLLRVESAPSVSRWSVWGFGVLLRRWLDYIRFLEPQYADAHALRARAESAARGLRLLPRALVRRRWLARCLRVVERRLPPRRPLVAFLDRERPDVVLVTPVVELGSPQTECVRAARALGIPTFFPVFSWDNLTVKGGIHELPDRVAVWNETQRREAVRLHGVPAERVVVTGAVAFDHWFDWQPTVPRKEFCRRAGLDPARRYLLYLGSSEFIAPHEGDTVLEWVRRLAPALREADAQILVRPHPSNPLDAAAVRALSDLGVPVRPRAAFNPAEALARGEFFDAMYHSAAVVGVNTSGMIESAILGRAVHTLLLDHYRGSQEQTLHFHYLLEENGGPVRVAASLGEHERQLLASLEAPADELRRRSLPFVERFVRPFGLDEPASPRLVAEIEDLAASAYPSSSTSASSRSTSGMRSTARHASAARSSSSE
jgi:hypothetical protein